MSPRGGYRGTHAVKKSRKLPTAKIAVYEECRDKINGLADKLNIPVVEFIYRIINHPNFDSMLKDIEENLADNWHEQVIVENSK